MSGNPFGSAGAGGDQGQKQNGGNLFGGASNSNNQSSAPSPFGNSSLGGNQNTSGSGSSLFGANTGASSPFGGGSAQNKGGFGFNTSSAPTGGNSSTQTTSQQSTAPTSQGNSSSGGPSWGFGAPKSNSNLATSGVPGSGGVGGNTPLFGSNIQQGPQANSGSGSAFGGGATTSPASSLFGKTATSGGPQSQQQSATSSGGLGFGLGAKTNQPSAGAPNTTPQANKPSSLSFSTTPAGNPPAAPSMFNPQPTQNQQQPASGGSAAPKPGGLFGEMSGSRASSTPQTVFSPPQSAGGQSSTQQQHSASATATGGFGLAQSSVPATQPPSGGLFAGVGDAGGSKPNSDPYTASKSTFGCNPQNPATTAPPAGATAGATTGTDLFSGAQKTAAQSDSAGGMPTGASGGSGLLSGNQKSSTPAASGAPATGSNLFSGLGGQNSSTTQPASTTATTIAPAASTPQQPGSATTSTAPASGGMFGALATPKQPEASGTSTAGAAAASTTQTSGTTNNNDNAANTATAGAAKSTAGATPTPQSRLAGKTMDEIITTWSTSLASHQKTFNTLATQIGQWDRQMVENSSKITSLYGRCFQAERDCAEVERQLSGVEHGQDELEKLLDKYENNVDDLLQKDGGMGENVGGGVDIERERTFKTAEACTTRLTEMSHSLTDMIDEINSASGKLSSSSSAKAGKDDPLAQIVRILNGHLVQLQGIDSGASALQESVEHAKREAGVLGNSQRNGMNGGNGWLDGFGRSYLGRP